MWRGQVGNIVFGLPAQQAFPLEFVEKVGTRAKKKEWGGRGKGAKETLARKPHDFEKLRSPTNAAFDWCGAGSVD